MNSLYDKIVSAFGMVRESADRKVSMSDIAGEFRSSASYSVGRLVVKDGSLYRCVQDHSGEWSDADFVRSTVADAVASAYSRG